MTIGERRRRVAFTCPAPEAEARMASPSSNSNDALTFSRWLSLAFVSRTSHGSPDSSDAATRRGCLDLLDHRPLESASFLAQTVADRDGVIPSSLRSGDVE